MSESNGASVPRVLAGRGQLAETYRKKIETIVRKPGKAEDEEEAVAPCPFCGAKSPASSLDCLQVGGGSSLRGREGRDCGGRC